VSDYREGPQNCTVMQVEVPRRVQRLIKEEPVIGYLATSYRDVPHVTPVWLDYEEESQQVIINVESKTLKLHNVRQNPNVCISFVAPDNSSWWVVLKGTATQVEDMGADTVQLQVQAQKYLGRPKRKSGHRFIIRIKIGHVRWWGEADR
jgi:general stress protein 26